jgi:hypothetical protein
MAEVVFNHPLPGEAGNAPAEPGQFETNRARPGIVGRAWVALSAFILGILLLVIQLYGFAAAIRGMRVEGLTADWCSTLFTQGIVVESDCELLPVEPSFSQGIGCVRLEGYDQHTWLKATSIIVSISLVFQVFDAVILTLVNGTTRWRGAKMKRPWFTMFTGNAILLILIVTGVIQSQRLPRGIDRSVIVYMKLGSPTTCVARLTPYGVRGAIIGWSDGFLSSWGETYSPKGN